MYIWRYTVYDCYTPIFSVNKRRHTYKDRRTIPGPRGGHNERTLFDLPPTLDFS